MADTFKILSQLDAQGGALSDLYTVPAATSTVLSSIVICNRNTFAVAFRISVAVGGAADDPKQYLYYDTPLDPNDTFVGTIGITLATTDKVRVQPSIGGVSVSLFGVEVT